MGGGLDMLKRGLLSFDNASHCLQIIIACTFNAEIDSNSPACKLTKYSIRHRYGGKT